MKKTAVTTSENQFAGKRGLLNLVNFIESIKDFGNMQDYELNSYFLEAWKECKTSEDFKLLSNIIIAAGDLQRQHLILEGKHTQYMGKGNRELFHALLRLAYHYDRKWAVEVLLPMAIEYSTFWHLLAFQVKTSKVKRGISSVIKVYDVLEWMNVEDLVSVVRDFLNTNKDEFKFICFWKYMNRFKTGKCRPETAQVRKHYREFGKLLTQAMGWQWFDKTQRVKDQNPTIYKMRAKYQSRNEANLFANPETGIKTFTADSFYHWLNQLPSGARQRVKQRLLQHPEKWVTADGKSMKEIYDTYIAQKFAAALEAQQLQQKVASGQATVADKLKLEKVTHKAKMGTAGVSLWNLFNTRRGSTDAEIDSLAFNIFKDVKDVTPGEIVVDISGSMSPYMEDAQKLVTAFMYLRKRDYPNEPQQIFIFGSYGRWIEEGSTTSFGGGNPLIRATDKRVDKMIDLNEGFSANYARMRKIVKVQSEATNINSIFQCVDAWVSDAGNDALKRMRAEYVSSIPVFRIITDGDFNDEDTAVKSLRAVQRNLQQKYNWNGIFIVWDISGKSKDSRFEEMADVIYLSGLEPEKLSAFAASLGDIKRPDVFSKLLAYRNAERYEPVTRLYEKIY